VFPSRSLQERRVLPTRTLSASGEATVPSVSCTSRTTSGELFHLVDMLQLCFVSYSCSLDSHVVLGTVLLWVGWLGFNAGSTFAANLKAGMAAFNTNLAGSVGSVAQSCRFPSTLWSCLADRAETGLHHSGLTWMILDFRLERKWSVVGFCTGAITG
jgi:hypothetical protein